MLAKALARQHRNRVAKGLGEAESIGIVYSLNTEQDYTIVSGFSHRLQKMRKKVQMIAYHPQKTAPNFYAQNLTSDLLLRNDVDLFFRPNKTCASDFMHKEFDILFDLSSSDDFTAECIALLSRAHFKIGSGDNKGLSDYDLIIQLAANSGNDQNRMEGLIEQMIFYTTTIRFRSKTS